MADSINPAVPSLLKPEHHIIIQNGLTMADHAQRHIDMAKRAGLPVEGYQKMLDEHRQKLLNLKNSYFPGT